MAQSSRGRAQDRAKVAAGQDHEVKYEKGRRLKGHRQKGGQESRQLPKESGSRNRPSLTAISSLCGTQRPRARECRALGVCASTTSNQIGLNSMNSHCMWSDLVFFQS